MPYRILDQVNSKLIKQSLTRFPYFRLESTRIVLKLSLISALLISLKFIFILLKKNSSARE